MITKRVQYRYDSVRNKIGMTDADGGLHTYTYDVMRRLTGVINPLGERTTYAYDLNGRRTSVQLANGTRTSYVYDVMSRVQMVHTLKSDDSTVSKFEYEYDGNGRRTSVLEADGSRVTWTYDRISQVTAEWRTGTNPHRHTFTYDSVGNRTLKIEDGQRTTLVYDACNQLLTSEDNGGTTTFTYDGNGNQTVVQKPSGDRTTMVWDYENRLIKTIQPSGGVTSMAYDADGLRLKLEEPTGTKLFVWDDQNYLAETDAAGTTETTFTTEPYTYGSLISHRKAGASSTYHFDALGSTRALTDASEAVSERYNYTAFGTLLGSPSLFTPFLWGGMVGYYWDAALATQYIRARHYQPAIARWISLDPIGFAGGDANLFRYVGNSPTSGSSERRVRLTGSAYGRWQLAVASTVLGYLSLDGMYEGRKGRILSSNPMGYRGRQESYIACCIAGNVDPSGLENQTITDLKDWADGLGDWGDDAKDWWNDQLDSIKGITELVALEKCKEWYEADKLLGDKWRSTLPNCPCKQKDATFANGWGNSRTDVTTHPGCDTCYRSLPKLKLNPLKLPEFLDQSGQQCCYLGGDLLTSGTGAGSLDRINAISNNLGHVQQDVWPSTICNLAGKAGMALYGDRRPVNKGNPKKPCPEKATPKPKE